MAHRVLILGCGAIAGGYDADRSPDERPLSHAGTIAQNDSFDLVACVDPDDATRSAFVERWGVQQAAPSLGALGAAPGDYDLIVIASPTGHHAAHLEWAATMKPRAVICEKPLASDLAQAEELAGRYEAAGIPLAVNYLRRWAPKIVVESGRIATGEYGAPIAASAIYTKGIVHNGGHMVDLLRFLLGDLQLHSVGPARFDHWDDDPTVSAILTAENGAPVHLIAGDARQVTQFELVLSFEKAQVAFRDGGRRIEHRVVEDSAVYAGYRELGLATSSAGALDGAMTSAYGNIRKTLDQGAPLASTARTALAAQRLCEDIRRKALDRLDKGTPE